MRLFFVISLILVSSCSIRRLERIGVYSELAPETYQNYVEDSLVNIIDVRTESEYAKSHIEGAINISYFSGHFKRELKALEIDRQKTTLIYCETQHRSLFAAKQFYKNGFHTIIDLDKGMMHWRKNNFPFVADSLSN